MTPTCRPRGSSRLAWAVLACLLGAGPALAATHEVLVRNFAFEPPELTIQAGDSVRWTVISGTHSVTAKDRAFDSGEFAAGSSFEQPRVESRLAAATGRLHLRSSRVIVIVSSVFERLGPLPPQTDHHPRAKVPVAGWGPGAPKLHPIGVQGQAAVTPKSDDGSSRFDA